MKVNICQGGGFILVIFHSPGPGPVAGVIKVRLIGGNNVGH